MKSFTDDKRGQKRIEKALKSAKKYDTVAVGILQEKKKKKSKFSMVDLAAVHEFGCPDRNIPQRSFIRSTCDAKSKKYIRLLKRLEKKVFLKELTAKQALTLVGEVVTKDIIQAINDGIEPKLSEKTIRKKKSSKPLINTGDLKGRISFKVQRGKK